MATMTEILGNHPLFQGLNEEELKHLEEITVQRHYARQAYVFMEGDSMEAVYFIRRGTIKIFKVDQNGNEQVINLLNPGEMFPHIGFFEDIPYPGTAEVMEDAELIAIRIEDFDNMLLVHPQITLKVMKIMGQKIHMLQLRVQELISQDMLHRVVRTLLRLAGEAGESDGDQVHINMPITNQDLANMVGSTRETINRALRQLKNKQLIRTNRHGILIYDIEQLKNFR